MLSVSPPSVNKPRFAGMHVNHSPGEGAPNDISHSKIHNTCLRTIRFPYFFLHFGKNQFSSSATFFTTKFDASRYNFFILHGFCEMAACIYELVCRFCIEVLFFFSCSVQSKGYPLWREASNRYRPSGKRGMPINHLGQVPAIREFCANENFNGDILGR